jgi:phenylalanyl-tRNA synthetase beta chain
VQPLFLAAVLSGERDPAGWWGPGRTADWTDAVELVRALGHELGVEVTVERAARMPWHPSRCARVLVEGEEFGHAGELHPRVCQGYGLPRGTSALEIDLDFLMARAVDAPRAPSYSHQPLAKEDVALVVDDTVPAAAVEAALRRGAGHLLESVRLFDVYTGPQIGDGKKSLAFALRFRAPDRTLTEAETGAARDAAVAAAAEAVGAVQR